MEERVFISIGVPELQRYIVECLEECLTKLKFQQETEKEILNVGEAAKFLSLSKQSIYNKVSLGELVPCKREGGRKLYFEREYLSEWLLEGSPRHQVSNYLKKKGVKNHE